MKEGSGSAGKGGWNSALSSNEFDSACPLLGPHAMPWEIRLWTKRRANTNTNSISKYLTILLLIWLTDLPAMFKPNSLRHTPHQINYETHSTPCLVMTLSISLCHSHSTQFRDNYTTTNVTATATTTTCTTNTNFASTTTITITNLKELRALQQGRSLPRERGHASTEIRRPRVVMPRSVVRVRSKWPLQL